MSQTDIDAALPLTPLTYRILLALADGALHGYAMIKAIEELEGESAAPSTGALYLALQRLESEGLIAESAAPADERDARRRYYALTRRGRAVAEAESARMAGLVAAARSRNLLREQGG
jgi:DNA-binding PadR family transcriptional regulator